MGSIRVQKGKYRTTYNAQVCVNGNRTAATFDKRSEARAWIEETEYLLRNGEPLPGELPSGDMEFEEAVDKYTLSVAKYKKMNSRRLDNECAKRLVRYFGGKSLQTIKPEDIASYRDYRAKRVGPSSIIQDMSFISCMYEMARLEWRLEVTNPEKDIRRPSPPANRNVLLKLSEITRLLDYCCISKNDKLYCFVLLMLQTAMRPGECAGLQWRQVLLDENMLDLTETKTDPRRVPLNPLAHSHLERLKETRDRKNKYVFLPKNTPAQRTDPGRYFRRSFENAVRYAGINKFTMYGLRHCAASYLLINGVDIRYVAEIMGHKNISQTMKYTHFLDQHKIEQAKALQAII